MALARPLMGSRQTEVKQTGVEMIIAVDVSTSMMAEDDKPTRLDHAKHEINSLLDQLGGDRVGLIAFAGSAILVCPMTSDHSAVKLFLSALSTNSVSTQGTNYKDVFEEAIRAFDRGGVEGLNGTKPTRVLVMASDGEDNEPGGLVEAKRAVDAGIRIFALGFGSERGAPIPMRDDRGQLRGFKQDREGKTVMSIPSDKGLAKLTTVGGGSYYHSTFDESEVKSLVADIDKLEKADFKTRMATEFDEKFQIPLLAGILIALLELVFGDRRGGVSFGEDGSKDETAGNGQRATGNGDFLERRCDGHSRNVARCVRIRSARDSIQRRWNSTVQNRRLCGCVRRFC